MKRTAITGLLTRIQLLAAIAWFRASALASPLPEPMLPAGVGVNIHFTRGHEHDLDLIAAAGFKVVRMDFTWAETERTVGSYDWSAYDELTANLARRGIRPYYILDYSNPLYEKGPPIDPAGVAAFARWAGAAANHFHGREILWEIWNEPNGDWFWKHPNAAQYSSLALATCKAIRQVDAGATIVGPATFEFPWPFLEGFLSSGVLAYLDGVSVHPYRGNNPPETAAANYQRLRELIARHTPRGRYVPIISGEWGYPSCAKRLSLATQADFIARQQLFNLFSGLPVSIWYDWQNDGQDPAKAGQNMGVVTYDLNPKPAYVAVQTLTRELSGCRISGRYDTGDKADFVLALTNSEGTVKLAAWTVGRPHPATIALAQPGSGRAFSWVNGAGVRGLLKVEGDGFTCDLDGTPKYVSLGKSAMVTRDRVRELH